MGEAQLGPLVDGIRAPVVEYAVQWERHMVTTTNTSGSAPGLRRWRTAFWSAVVATPLLAGVLGALLGAWMDGENRLAAEMSLVAGVVVVVNVLAWRWPRASGVALGATALLLAVVLVWGIGFGAAVVAR